MMKTKKLVLTGILAALSIVLIMTTRMPLIPSATFLMYEAGDVPMLLAATLFGPLYGLAIVVIASVIQAFTFDAGSGIIGMIMHIIASGTLVTVSGLVYKACSKGMISEAVSLIIGLASGTAAMTLIMIPANMIAW
ncbi:MAG TPA: ECF transporter S component, partial [Clostridia bacterium]|nr:ECF transporter S component [Clostridia bacterium]